MVAEELKAHPDAVVTDVASVKAGVLTALRRPAPTCGPTSAATRWPGASGPARWLRAGDLFLGRPWVLSPAPDVDPAALAAVRRLALALGAVPVVMTAAEHDEAVALVSHVPQVAASLVAARLAARPGRRVALAGQGLRDVTRIAGSDPALWAQILAANAGPVAAVLAEVRDDLDRAAGRACRRSPTRRRTADAVGARGDVAHTVAGRESRP